MKEVIRFGSPLARFEVDQAMVDELNRISDFILKDGQIPAKYDFTKRLASAVDIEFKIPFELMEEIKAQLEAYALEYHESFCEKSYKKPNSQARMTTCWIVSQKAGEWNYLHRHSDSISGVLYLKVPSDFSPGVSEGNGKRRHPGEIAFTEGAGNFYKATTINRIPRVGDLYLFPSDLLHTVYPFFGPEERRSFAFNFKIE